VWRGQTVRAAGSGGRPGFDLTLWKEFTNRRRSYAKQKKKEGRKHVEMERLGLGGGRGEGTLRHAADGAKGCMEWRAVRWSALRLSGQRQEGGSASSERATRIHLQSSRLPSSGRRMGRQGTSPCNGSRARHRAITMEVSDV
jgi:hypothetical protein